MPSAGEQAVNGQLRAEVAALRVTVAAHGSTSECSSQTDAPHGDMESGAAADAKSERIAQLAYAPGGPDHRLASITNGCWLPGLKFPAKQVLSWTGALQLRVYAFQAHFIRSFVFAEQAGVGSAGSAEGPPESNPHRITRIAGVLSLKRARRTQRWRQGAAAGAAYMCRGPRPWQAAGAMPRRSPLSARLPPRRLPARR